MKITIFTLCIAILALSLSISQGKPTDEKPATKNRLLDFDEIPPVVKSSKLSLSLSSAKENYKGGEDIIMDISMKNNGDDPVRLYMQDVEMFYNIEVIGPDGKEAPLLNSRFRRRYGSGEAFGLRHNDSQLATVWLNRIFDMSAEGPYTLRVSKTLALDDNRKTLVTLSSKPLTVNVTSTLPVAQWR